MTPGALHVLVIWAVMGFPLWVAVGCAIAWEDVFPAPERERPQDHPGAFPSILAHGGEASRTLQARE